MKNKYKLLVPPRFSKYVFAVFQFALCLAFSSSVAGADAGDFFSKFHPSLTVQEEYNDNIYLTSSDRKSDFITTIYPGIRFSTSPARVTTPGQILQTPEGPSGIDLDYRLGLVFYARESQNDYFSHEGTLNTWYNYDQRLTLRLRDMFTRSEDTRERDYRYGRTEEMYLLGTQRARAIHTRNVFEPSVNYRFGSDGRISLTYINNIYKNQDPSYINSQENTVSPHLDYWFNIRNGMTLDYSFTRGLFEHSSDFTLHMAAGRYTYRFNPRTSAYLGYTFSRRDFDALSSTDYEISNPNIGIEHAFSSTLTGRVQVGYFWQNPGGRPSTGGLSYDVGLTKREARTSYTLSFQGGYMEDYFSAENLGFTKYYRAVASIAHRPEQRVALGISGTLERAEYVSDRNDWLFSAAGNVSFEMLRWLSLSLDASHRGNNSSLDGAGYRENRIFLRISATL